MFKVSWVCEGSLVDIQMDTFRGLNNESHRGATMRGRGQGGGGARTFDSIGIELNVKERNSTGIRA